MNALDWTQIALFGAGVVVHFLYTRLAPPTSSSAPPSSSAATTTPSLVSSSPTNANEVVQVLAALANAVLNQQTTAGQPASATGSAQTPALSNTETGLLSLLHKLVDRQTQPASTSAPAPAATSH